MQPRTKHGFLCTNCDESRVNCDDTLGLPTESVAGGTEIEEFERETAVLLDSLETAATASWEPYSWEEKPQASALWAK